MAFEPHRAEVETRRQRHIELEASARAAGLAAKQARIAADANRKSGGRKGDASVPKGQRPRGGEAERGEVGPKGFPPTSPSTPEVIVLPRRPSVRPPI